MFTHHNIIISFCYIATLCISAVFAVARCLSVRVTRWFIVSRVQTDKNIVKFLFLPNSIIIFILVFLSPSAGTQFQAEPIQLGAKYTGSWEKIANFDRNRRLFRKRYEIVPLCYGRLIENNR